MTLKYDLEGSGPVVLLLHSSVCDRRMWQPQTTPLLAAGFRVLRPDFRGYGDTPAPTAAYSDADDVRALLDELDLATVHLVGASFGGRVAQEVAARWPHRIASLALVCAGAQGHPKTADVAAFGARENELIEARDLDAAVALNVATWVGPAATAPTREFVGVMQRRAFDLQIDAPEVDSPDADHDLAAITAPTLVVSGAHDLDYFTEIAAHLAKEIPGARHTVLDWAGHLPSLEHPARFNPLLLEFLSSQPR
ncbi:pimeloyl-ACP methyl ester carboxylesterase [Allocatelliglobosispora scoriae]|uniref:Pimeloyl-ACP methyl ester carboxylesterase n=1 Tax=Allocatelliglobosispora scoriae TaxID=643052 RepID=A0A841C354_9ACTN|nr:alpha/beta fold hydrolase [Allocatelliglobosispora scoriae]MBB5873271.1 pimeloyl-ACP methyl ester carboxylesterase [Allocatelliglobosispora scoriae]